MILADLFLKLIRILEVYQVNGCPTSSDNNLFNSQTPLSFIARQLRNFNRISHTKFRLRKTRSFAHDLPEIKNVVVSTFNIQAGLVVVQKIIMLTCSTILNK